MYLICRTPLDYLGGICALGDASGFGGLAARACNSSQRSRLLMLLTALHRELRYNRQEAERESHNDIGSQRQSFRCTVLMLQDGLLLGLAPYAALKKVHARTLRDMKKRSRRHEPG